MAFIHRRTFIRVAVSVAVFPIACFQAAVAKDKSVASSTPKGQTLYTRFSLYYEDLRHRTTNYRKGILVPVNTEVQFVKAKGDNIVVKLPSGQELTIENVEPFSGENLDGIFSRTFSPERTDLTQFTEEERKEIMAGQVKPGMRKSAVIVALGYPPKHKTPTLDSSEWRYWQNRFATFLVQFDGDAVTKVKQ